MSDEKEKPEENSETEEVEVVEEKTPVRRLTPKLWLRERERNGRTTKLFMSMTCTGTGFLIMHRM